MVIPKEIAKSPEKPPEYVEEFKVWLKQNWFPFSLIIAIFSLVTIAGYAVRGRGKE